MKRSLGRGPETPYPVSRARAVFPVSSSHQAELPAGHSCSHSQVGVGWLWQVWVCVEKVMLTSELPDILQPSFQVTKRKICK